MLIHAPQLSAKSPLNICIANYADPVHARLVIDLLDAYVQDPAGGGKALSAFVKTNLVQELTKRLQTFSVLAFDDDAPVGLVNYIEGFSTFACKPLINVHDLAVLSRQRVGEKMLARVEQITMKRGACKITMEVSSGNLSTDRKFNLMRQSIAQVETCEGH